MTPEQRQRIQGENDNLLNEANVLRSRYEKQWTTNLRRYLNDQWDSSSNSRMERYVFPLVQNVVVTAAQIQTEQRPRVIMSPVESNEPALYYLREGVGQLLDGVDSGGYTPEQLSGVEPMSEEQAVALMQLTQPVVTEQETVDADGVAEQTDVVEEQPLVTADDFIIVDDQTTTDAVKVIFDILWEKANTDHILLENVLNKGVVGHQPMLVQWDFEKHQYDLLNPHQFNVWIDPLASSLGTPDAEYAILEEVYSANTAKKKYPEFADQIDKYKSDGTPSDGDRFTRGSKYQQPFEREMVAIRTTWRRNQPVPISEDEIEQHGLSIAMTEDGTELPGVYVTGEGELTASDNDNWPTKVGLQQVKQINSQVVEVVECPYDDIPMPWNINIPIPHRPYGQGDPERCEDVQQIINRVFSIIANNLRYFQSPQQIGSMRLRKALGSKANQMFSSPDRTLWVPDDVKDDFSIIDPPSLQTSYMEFAEQLLSLFDRISGNSKQLQGFTDPDAESGRAIQALQEAARGPMGFKSRFTEQAIKHLTRLVWGMIRDFLPESMWQRYVSEYPIQVLRAIRDRMKSLEVDIKVEVVAGSRSSKAAEEERALALFDRGLTDPITTLKQLNVPDAEEIGQRIMAMAAQNQQAG